jgi:hypothetical protein
MANYQKPEKVPIRKRNKTAYNMFFSAHVQQMRQETCAPTERGTAARLVAEKWKTLSLEQKEIYEREADKHNETNPIEQADDEVDEANRRHAIDFFAHMHAPPHPPPHMDLHSMGFPLPMHMHPDPRQYYPPVLYGGQPNYYDYSQHHQRPPQQARGYQSRYPSYDD